MTPIRCANYEEEERQRIPASHCLYCNIHPTQHGLLTSESSKAEVTSRLIKEHKKNERERERDNKVGIEEISSQQLAEQYSRLFNSEARF